ncbi:hypothetical protein [Streptomyces sp. CB01881]|uniref:hypothetical protein n=1 Tax=Streptomyces sp. CB01881 TaxID=2078691 RepID=UPI000CDCDB4E|nr:hypothetical protein [Streptomyces sp. CB01881]AUY53618.1 hypothetical protein C2142_37715 [Streptomyces sp. CB01881]TYC68634.1 hypothetical protein EH183_37730 [Streptomyces sp. CB01881]
MTFHLTPRFRWVLGLTAALAVAGTGAGILLTSGNDGEADRPAAVKPSNIAGRRTACLTGDATEAAGRTDTSLIWSALQDASQQDQLNVQQLLVPAATVDQALPYLSGLSAQRCDLVVSIGPTFTQALEAAAKANPHTRFVAVTTDGQPAPGGVVTVTGSDNEKAAEVRRRALDLPAPGN